MSRISLHVCPRKVISWDEFIATHPPRSIALDGYVKGSTRRDRKGPYANFNHHEGVDRSSTKATCDQVQYEITMGLFAGFKQEGVPTAHVYINDPDEDTSTAVWLLRNHETVARGDAKINRLVRCEGLLDVSAGAYPIGDTTFRRVMTWIFAPYNHARFSGRIAVMEEAEMCNVVDAVGQRITQHVFGDGGEEIALTGHYDRIGGGEGWTFTRETGPASRMAMYNDGINAFVSLVAQKPDGSFVYVVGSRSAWYPFDLARIFAAANAAEPAGLVTDDNLWAGGDTIGGSPKKTGSKNHPEIIQQVVNAAISSD